MVVVVGAQSESSTTEVVEAYIYASFLHLHISLHLRVEEDTHNSIESFLLIFY